MKKNILLMSIFFLWFLWLLPSGVLLAKERRGARVSVLKNDRTTIAGELIAVKRDSSLLLDAAGRESIALSDVNIVKVVRAPKGALFIVPGMVLGGMAGKQLGEGFGKIATGGFGAMLGGVVGLIAGGALSQPGIYQIAGKSEKEIQAILNKLRSRARFPSYQ
jgi:hypothetical protein